MAQDFERHFLTGVGTTPQDIPDGADFNSDDAIVGIHLANTTNNTINASVFMTTSSQAGVGGDFNFEVKVVSSGGNKFNFDGGAAAPVLQLKRGFTYKFDQSHSDNDGHPLAFKTSGGASYITGVVFKLDGVTKTLSEYSNTTAFNAATTRQILFTVANDAPDSLVYYCTVHGNAMGNTITITNAHHIIKDVPIPSGSSLQVLDGGAKMVVQSGDRLFVKSDTVSSLDAWVSVVDSIST